jgi:predicted nucleotide-binding protein
MATKINPVLLDKLVAKIGVGKTRVYKIIQDKADEANVDSHVASLLVAKDYGVGFQRYIRDGDRAEMRGIHVTRPALTATDNAPPARPTPQRAPSAAPRQVKTTKNNSVFVVHGRDEELRQSMFDLLLRLGLNPMEWSHAIAAAKGANPNIGDTINNAMKKVQAVIVMFSPDEQAKLRGKFCTPKERDTLGKLGSQSRPNVLFEAGLALGAHPEKTLLVQVGDMRDMSDIAGKHILRLSNSPASRNELAERLRKLKFKVNTTGQDWFKVGNFDR